MPEQFAEFMSFVMGNKDETPLLSPLSGAPNRDDQRKGEGLCEGNQREVAHSFFSEDRAQTWATCVADTGLTPSFGGVSLF